MAVVSPARPLSFRPALAREGERPREARTTWRPPISERVSVPLLLLFTFSLSAAPLQLSPLYSSDMVLPCDTPFAIAGEAAPDAEVTVRLGAGAERRVRADNQGRWRADMPATPPSAAPADLAVRSGDACIVCTNVLVGDLWVCAGQSNMAFPLTSCDTAKDAVAAATDPRLRCFNVSCRLPTWNKPWNDTFLALSKRPEAFSASWCAVTPQTAPALSGVGVLFGQSLRRARPGVPLGLIQLAVGGAPVEAFCPAPAGNRPAAWIDDPSFAAPWCQERAKVNLSRAFGSPGFADIRHPYEPGLLYERGIVPLTALPVKGVLWYQGESNASSCGTPDTALEADVMYAGLAALVRSWRRAWNSERLPFVMVQLPRMNRPWMLFREQQMRVAQTFQNVGLVIATDTGNPSNVHPADKAIVAVRATGEALRVAYHDPKAPVFAFAVSAQGGSPVTVRFTPGPSLVSKGGTLTGFELSADGSTFVPAGATLKPDNTVDVTAESVPAPLEVRYNWSPVPQGNLFNAAGLPVAPFRLKTTP